MLRFWPFPAGAVLAATGCAFAASPLAVAAAAVACAGCACAAFRASRCSFSACLQMLNRPSLAVTLLAKTSRVAGWVVPWCLQCFWPSGWASIVAAGTLLIVAGSMPAQGSLAADLADFVDLVAVAVRGALIRP